MIPILQIFQILQIHSDCKLRICWLPEGPAAGAKPQDPLPPRRGTGRAKRALALSPDSCLTLQVLKAQGGPPLPPAPPKSDPKVHQKVIKNRIRNNIRFLNPNGFPKGPSKSQKSHQMCKMVASKAFPELSRLLLLQKGFQSRPQGPPEPQKL